jgi:transposase
LGGFAKHLCCDKPALLAALELPWGNGPVEGHIHHLKLIKRSAYGRANFDLQRIRVLNAAREALLKAHWQKPARLSPDLRKNRF